MNLMQIRFEFKQGYKEVTEWNCRKSLVERKTAVIYLFKHEKKWLKLLFEANGSHLLLFVRDI